MESILTSLPNLQIQEKIRDDDFVDQMHHFITVYLFAFFGLVVGLKEYMGTPLDCWVEPQTWQHYQAHANSYCWSHKLYQFPHRHDLSKVELHIERADTSSGSFVWCLLPIITIFYEQIYTEKRETSHG